MNKMVINYKDEDSKSIEALQKLCDTLELEYSIIVGGKRGRKEVEMPTEWEKYYIKYINKEMNYKEVMEKLGLKKTTFYKLRDEYEKSRK